MSTRASSTLVWFAIVVAVLALVPIVAMTLMVASIIWMPLAGALAIVAIALLIQSRRTRVY
jgi:hypothetical protein